MSAASGSPYRGLAPFGDGEHDAALFFGREHETEVVVANLMASRLTVLYGASGVGKSSLLRAGVARRLRSTDRSDTGRHVVVVCASWSGDPLAAVSDAISEEVSRVLDGDVRTRVEAGFVDQLEEWCDALDGEIYIVLDQLEEYVLYHGADRGGPLADALADVVTRAGLRVGVLLGIRDDALSQLDAFKARVPSTYANLIRLDRLSREAGRQAIVGPLSVVSSPPARAEPELVERVLDEVAAGRISVTDGRGQLPEGREQGRIEAPYLQLVMERLWEIEQSRGSDLIHAETLRELGGSARIVEEHLGALDAADRDVAAAVFGFLVTSSGTKIAHTTADLARYAAVPEPDLRRVVTHLEEQRVLRPVADEQGGPPRHEIFHDVLGDAVLAWSAAHDADRDLERAREESRRRQRRLAWLASAAVVALAVTSGLALWALVERRNARDSESDAKAHELEARAVNLMPVDPALALALSAEAARLSPSESAAGALRQALMLDHLVLSLPVGAAITDLAYGSGALGVGTLDGRALLYDTSLLGRSAPVTTRHPAPVVQVVLRGESLWSAGLDGTARLTARQQKPGGERLVLRHPSPVATVAAGDGSSLSCPTDDPCVVTGSGRSVVTWSEVTGRRLGVIAIPARVREIVPLGSGRAVVRSVDTTLRIVDLRRQRVVDRLLAGQQIDSVAARPDGELVAAGLADGSVRVWEASTGRLRAALRPHKRRVLDLDLAGDLLLTGSAGGTATVVDLASGETVPLAGGHSNLVRAVELSRDGRFAVTGSADGTAKVWETDVGRLAAVLAGHTGAVVDVAFVAGGTRVVTGSTDGTIRLWDSGVTPELRVSPGPGPTRPQRTARASDGAVAAIEGNAVGLRASTGATLALRGHRDQVNSVAFSADGSLLASASRDHEVRIWDARSGALVHRLSGRHFGSVVDARFSPDGRWLVSAGPITAGLWNVHTGEFVTYLRGPTANLTAASFTPDSREITTSEAGGVVRRYRCWPCGSVGELRALADQRIRSTRRPLTADERRRYLR